MLNDRTDYNFVNGKIDQIDIKGDIMSLRSNKRQLKGEDITWVQEYLSDILSKCQIVGHGTSKNIPTMTRDTPNSYSIPVKSESRFLPVCDTNFNISCDFTNEISRQQLNKIIPFTRENCEYTQYINDFKFTVQSDVKDESTIPGGDIEEVMHLRPIYIGPSESFFKEEPTMLNKSTLALSTLTNIYSMFYDNRKDINNRDILWYKKVASYFKAPIIMLGHSASYNEIQNYYDIEIIRDDESQRRTDQILSMINRDKDIMFYNYAYVNVVDQHTRYNTGFRCTPNPQDILLSIKWNGSHDDLKHVYAQFYQETYGSIYGQETHDYQYNIFVDLIDYGYWQGDYFVIRTGSIPLQSLFDKYANTYTAVQNFYSFYSGDSSWGKINGTSYIEQRLCLYEIGIQVAPRAQLF